MTVERRAAGGEIRVEGRRLSGIVMRYGDVSPSHRERFLPGSLRLADAVHLDLFHDIERAVAWHPGGGLTLQNGRNTLSMRAELTPIPAADRALDEVRSGKVGGLSVEFRAVKEHRDGDIRVIEEAILSGVGIVRAPSYLQSGVEARQRSGRTLRAAIPTDTDAACECQAGDCNRVRLLSEAMDDMWKEAFEGGTEQIVAAYFENYSGPLASTSRGTLRGSIRGTGFQGRQPIVDIDLPDSQVGRNLLAAWDASGLIVRPFLADTVGPIVNGVRQIQGGRLRAFMVTSTDSREGWPEPEIVATPGELASANAPRRRTPRWL